MPLPLITIRILQLPEDSDATVQNKMHYRSSCHRRLELIVERADHTKEHMGLTTWADAPEGKIKKSDVTVAKNYLSQGEMKQLNCMVTAYLDFAENMTLRHIPLTMQDWEKGLIVLLKCLIMVFCRMQGKWQLKLQSFMPRLNLKSIASFRTDCSCLTLINTCWNWKKMRRSNRSGSPFQSWEFQAQQGRVHEKLNIS